MTSRNNKFKYIGLILVVLIFFTGLFLRNNFVDFSNPTKNWREWSHALNIQDIFREDKSRYYFQKFKTIGDKLAKHVKSIARSEKTKTDKLGFRYTQYLYANKDIDIDVFNKKLVEINTEYKKLKLDISNNKLPNHNKINEILNYYKSVCFFTVNEIWFRAYNTSETDDLKKITHEIESLVADSYFNDFLKKSNELIFAEKLISEIRIINKKYGIRNRLKHLKNEIEEYKYSADYIDYSDLIDRHNNLAREYNSKQIIQEELFSSFIALVDVHLLFPAQDTIKLKINKSKKKG